VEKNTPLGIFNNANNQPMNGSEYVSRLTKDFILMNRK